MVRTILYRELHKSFTSSVLRSALVVLTVLVPLSAYIQARYYQRLVEDYNLRQNIHQTENNSQAIVLIQPPPSMLPLFNGAYDVLPDEFRVRSDSATINPLSGDLMPLDWLFPKIDLSFIIGVLMTLLAILLAHESVTGDRDQGALKLILAGPIRRRTVLACKLLGVILPMILLLIYVEFLYIGVVIFFSGGTFTVSATNIGLIIGSTLGAVLLLMVAVAFSTSIPLLVKRSLISMFVCTSIWILAILVWPSFGPYIAAYYKSVSPLQTAQREIAFKERELIQEELAEHRELAIRMKADNAGVEFAWHQYLELNRRWIAKRNEQIGRLVNERRKHVNEQQAFARRILLPSPYIAFQEIMGSLGDTGLERYNNFLTEVETYSQQEFLPDSFDLLATQKPWLNTASVNDQIHLRPLKTSSQTFLTRLSSVVWPFFILIAELLILLIVGIACFERYDVR